MKKLCLLLLLSYHSFAYSQYDENFKNNYEKAINYANSGDYNKALPLFIELCKIDTNNANINFNIGVCYINFAFDKTRSIPYLEKAIKNVSKKSVAKYDDPSAPVYAYYYLGKAYHLNYNIDKAIECFNNFKQYFKECPKNILKDVDRQIEMCENAGMLMEMPVEIISEKLDPEINTEYPEYSPVISEDGSSLFFTSRRKGSTGDLKDEDGKYFEDIYEAKLNQKEHSRITVKQISAINTANHEACVSLSADGKNLFIYRDDNGNGNLYVSHLKNGEWSAPVDLGPEVNTKAWETHACLSPDGETLYFVSDRKGGFGGRDIWYCKKMPGGRWSEAMSLGETINTEYDEEAPFMLSNGKTLYFCSQGHESMGGFDIFVSCVTDEGIWSVPENVGYPINSTDDDAFYVPTSDEKYGYYSSVKPNGYGDQDIYRFTVLKNRRQLLSEKNNSKKTQDGETVFRVQIASLNNSNAKSYFQKKYNVSNKEIFLDEYNGTYKYSIGNFSSYKEAKEFNNTFLRLTGVNVFITKYVNGKKTEEFDIADLYENITKNKVEDKQETVQKPILFKDVYFDFDKNFLTEDAAEILDETVAILNKNTNLKIEVAGHTDNKGSSEYNKILSEKRAKVVFDYLVDKGINKERLSCKGYGEDISVADNTTKDGRQKNRRIEFIIIN